jgi:hypothetical protein
MQLTEENVRDYAESLVAQVRAGDAEMASRLDFTERSVWALEALFRASDERLSAPDTPDRARELTLFYGGCYLGETLAQTLGGTWRFTDDWVDTSLVFPYGEGGLQVFPFQKLVRRMNDGARGNDLVDYYEGLKNHLRGQN